MPAEAARRSTPVSPILVLGLPRSGTSLVAGALAACGAWVGQTVPPSPDNPRGFFENVRLRESVNKRILHASGYDPLGVHPLPPLDAIAAPPRLADEIATALRDEGYAGDRPWLFKDAKLTLLWPLWLDAFPGARWVVVRRRVEDVVRSCLGTRFMAQHSEDRAFWRRFVSEYEERLDALRAAAACTLEVWPQEIVEGDTQPLRELATALGLDWNAAAVEALVERRHWHA